MKSTNLEQLCKIFGNYKRRNCKNVEKRFFVFGWIRIFILEIKKNNPKKRIGTNICKYIFWTLLSMLHMVETITAKQWEAMIVSNTCKIFISLGYLTFLIWNAFCKPFKTRYKERPLTEVILIALSVCIVIKYTVKASNSRIWKTENRIR